VSTLGALERRRRRAVDRGRVPAPLLPLLSRPWPRSSQDVLDVRFLAVDLETTGLDPEADRILSIGWVPVEEGRIRLGRAGYAVIRHAEVARTDAVLVHGLTREVLERGAPLETVLAALMPELAGSVLVAHESSIERAFLGRACERAWGVRPEVPVLDTVRVERSLAGFGRESRDLRLPALRERYRLPPHRAHHALSDAVAAAEVMLCQWREISGSRTTRLRRVVG